MERRAQDVEQEITVTMVKNADRAILIQQPQDAIRATRPQANAMAACQDMDMMEKLTPARDAKQDRSVPMERRANHVILGQC